MIFASLDITVSIVHAYALPVTPFLELMIFQQLIHTLQVFFQIEYGAAVFMLNFASIPQNLQYVAHMLTILLFYGLFPILTCHFIYRFLSITR